jgi:hypothetical protein
MDAYRIEDCIEQATITIGRGDYARIEDGRGATVTVAYGSVWLTQARDPEDVCLQAGDSFRIRRNGVTIASGSKPSMLVVTPFTPESRPMRVAVATRGMEAPVELFRTGTPKRPLADRLGRFWTSLFVPSACPTTAAL